MRQVFKTRYTKKDPRIKSWYGRGQKGNEVVVAFPENMETPFRGRSLSEMDWFADDNLDEQLFYWSYEKDSSPLDVLRSLKGEGVTYEEVIF